MARVPVYSVDLSHGNLTPSLDTHGWGPMKIGDSGPAGSPSSAPSPQGLDLAVTGTGTDTAIGAYVVPPAGALPLESRLMLQLEFDQPRAIQAAAPASAPPEPWAVGLLVKAGDEAFDPDEKRVGTTCQFNRQFNGVRLNTPGHLEGDPSKVCLTPLDYDALTPGLFTLELYFCGVNAAGRQAIGFSRLVIGPPLRKEDQRVFSNSGLSDIAPQTSLGALGAMLVTQKGMGQLRARFRAFNVSIWT